MELVLCQGTVIACTVIAKDMLDTREFFYVDVDRVNPFTIASVVPQLECHKFYKNNNFRMKVFVVIDDHIVRLP